MLRESKPNQAFYTEEVPAECTPLKSEVDRSRAEGWVCRRSTPLRSQHRQRRCPYPSPRSSRHSPPAKARRTKSLHTTPSPTHSCYQSPSTSIPQCSKSCRRTPSAPLEAQWEQTCAYFDCSDVSAIHTVQEGTESVSEPGVESEDQTEAEEGELDG